MIKNDITFTNLIKILKENDIKDIVINPGGTNIKFVKLVQEDSYFNCYSVVDERSAVYFAIGLYLQTGRKIAMSCTSAQATRNYIPGLTEAYYKRVPILAITMSKHPRFTYQEYMQAPDQTSLPKDCVKKSYAVPYVSDDNDLLHSIRIMNEAVLELSNNTFGPIQLCIPALDRELGNVETEVKYIQRVTHNNVGNSFDLLKNKKVLIIIGEHTKINDELQKQIEQFCEKYNSAIYINHLSNYYGRYSVEANLMFSVFKVSDFDKIKPDIFITIGGQTGDYPLYNILSSLELKNIEHWRVEKTGDVVDTYDKLTKIFKMEEIEFFRLANSYEQSNKKNTSYFEELFNLTKKYSTNFEVPFSSVFAAQILSTNIKSNSTIQFSILNSLRVWNLFKLNDNIDCYSNVGAFGIDGGMSTLIGQSIVSNNDCYMVIGDLAFLYDINSLSIRHIKSNLKILLINNNGGVEFKLYKNADNFEKTNMYIAAGNHFKNAKGWANDCGFEYLCASSKEEFINNVSKFTSKSDKPIIFELFVKDSDDVNAYNEILSKNSEHKIEDFVDTTKSKMKKMIKGILNK